jgi:hypothetical protein
MCFRGFVSSPLFQVQRVADPPQPPPLVTMTLAMKTVVNPVTHTHECVVLSALTHNKTDLENVTDLSPSLMRQVQKCIVLQA